MSLQHTCMPASTSKVYSTCVVPAFCSTGIKNPTCTGESAVSPKSFNLPPTSLSLSHVGLPACHFHPMLQLFSRVNNVHVTTLFLFYFATVSPKIVYNLACLCLMKLMSLIVLWCSVGQVLCWWRCLRVHMQTQCKHMVYINHFTVYANRHMTFTTCTYCVHVNVHVNNHASIQPVVKVLSNMGEAK